MRIYDYADVISEIVEDTRPVERMGRVGRGLKRRYEALVNSAVSADALAGDAVLATLRATLDAFGYVRTSGQRRFHDEFIKASLPHIFGASFEHHKERIMRDFGMEKMSQEVLICTPRRFGKTTACALFCAAMALCVPHTWISIFSTGQRASTMLLDQTAQRLERRR